MREILEALNQRCNRWQHHTAFSQTWLWLYLQHFSNQTSVFSGISSGYLVAASLKAEIAETWRLEAQAKAGKWPRWWITQDGKLEYRSACYSYDIYLFLDYSGSYIINDEMMRMMMVKKVHLAFTPAVKYIAKIHHNTSPIFSASPKYLWTVDANNWIWCSWRCHWFVV